MSGTARPSAQSTARPPCPRAARPARAVSRPAARSLLPRPRTEGTPATLDQPRQRSMPARRAGRSCCCFDSSGSISRHCAVKASSRTASTRRNAMCTWPRAAAPAVAPISSANRRYRPCCTRVLAVSGRPMFSNSRRICRLTVRRGRIGLRSSSAIAPHVELTSCCATSAQAPAPARALTTPVRVPNPCPVSVRHASFR